MSFCLSSYTCFPVSHKFSSGLYSKSCYDYCQWQNSDVIRHLPTERKSSLFEWPVLLKECLILPLIQSALTLICLLLDRRSDHINHSHKLLGLSCWGKEWLACLVSQHLMPVLQGFLHNIWGAPTSKEVWKWSLSSASDPIVFNESCRCSVPLGARPFIIIKRPDLSWKLCH